MKAYARAYEARNGKPLTDTYLPLTFERGWVTFRSRERPHSIDARYRVAVLIDMTARLSDRAADPQAS